MAEKKQDIRISKTQRSLVQALFSLLQNQSFSKITINDICGEAMVSRSTFYAHFEDKYSLMKFSMLELDKRIFADFDDGDLRKLLTFVLENMLKNAKTLRNLVTAEVDIELREIFRNHFTEIFKRYMRKRGFNDEVLGPKMEVAASFCAAGVSQTTMLWITKKLPLSIDDMTDILCVLLQGFEYIPIASDL